jgi:hypothetical protein
LPTALFVFARVHSRPGQEPPYIKGGDPVRVPLTGVTEIGEADPVTGQAIVQLTWGPLGGRTGRRAAWPIVL